ncbi:MAG: hypothetical protein A2Y31_13900 [Spirochaetes bacterium GWC2_52_13]|nr:MAG: hypothetical protein A2Y31_13900 [Spirochaetes bacterium GWC2_52_13]OHD65193.1 MAG: hypothetical protein A2101_06215 [Spirochaetes bacterium GWF2_52_7]
MFAICVVMCMIRLKAIRTTVFNQEPLLTPFLKIGFVHFAALPSRTSHPKTKPLIAQRLGTVTVRSISLFGELA